MKAAPARRSANAASFTRKRPASAPCLTSGAPLADSEGYLTGGSASEITGVGERRGSSGLALSATPSSSHCGMVRDELDFGVVHSSTMATPSSSFAYFVCLLPIAGLHRTPLDVRGIACGSAAGAPACCARADGSAGAAGELRFTSWCSRESGTSNALCCGGHAKVISSNALSSSSATANRCLLPSGTARGMAPAVLRARYFVARPGMKTERARRAMRHASRPRTRPGAGVRNGAIVRYMHVDVAVLKKAKREGEEPSI